MAFLVLFSCASTGSFVKLDDTVGRNHFIEAVDHLEKNRASLYSNRDAILYYLDKGMLSHYAQLYADSSRLLQDGEQAIEEAFTISITRELGTYLVNDNTREYSGEDYEDIYINVFNALNYYHRGEIEGALVEIRRISDKLTYLATKYDVVVSELQKAALKDNVENIPPFSGEMGSFSDSALARYLGILFYRSNNQYDDARIDRDGVRLAFANAPQLYQFPVPSSISDELDIPRGMARFNLIAFSGLSPVKQSVEMRIPLPGYRWAKIALPEMMSRPSAVTRIELVFDHGQRLNLELLEDIDAVAKETFKARQNVIYLKSTIRAMVKAIGSVALGAAAEKEEDAGKSIVLSLLGIVTQVFAEVSEQADLRVSRYFPGKAHVAGINLAPGVYSFDVIYYDRSGKHIAVDRHQNIVVKENALNLIESFCLK